MVVWYVLRNFAMGCALLMAGEFRGISNGEVGVPFRYDHSFGEVLHVAREALGAADIESPMSIIGVPHFTEHIAAGMAQNGLGWQRSGKSLLKGPAGTIVVVEPLDLAPDETDATVQGVIDFWHDALNRRRRLLQTHASTADPASWAAFAERICSARPELAEALTRPRPTKPATYKLRLDKLCTWVEPDDSGRWSRPRAIFSHYGILLSSWFD